MCILKRDDCKRCETEYGDIYRCIGKLLNLEAPPCNINSKVFHNSDNFICMICIVEEKGDEGLNTLLEYLKVEYELKQKALTTTGNESYTVFM